MRNFLKFLDNFELYISYVLIVVLAILLTFQVFNRYVFHETFVWLEEIVRLSFVWMIYFAVAGAARANAHIRVGLIDLILPPAAIRVLTVFADVISIGFCVTVVWFGIQLVESSHRYGSVSPVTDVPMSLVYSVIPVCFTLIAIRTTQAIFAETRKSDASDSTHTAPLE